MLCAVLAGLIGTSAANLLLFEQVNTAADRFVPDPVLTGATILGNGLCALMLLAPALRHAPRLVAGGLLATPVAGLFTQLPKHLIGEARPAAVLGPGSIHVHGIRLAGTNSFPSGHAITAFTLVAVLLVGHRVIRRRPALGAAIILAALLVAASRVAVGAHWPADVLAGAVLGSAAGAIGLLWSAHWRFWGDTPGRVLLALIVAGAALALARTDTGYPSARALQFALAALGLGSALWSIWWLRPGVREPGAGTERPAAPHIS